MIHATAETTTSTELGVKLPTGRIIWEHPGTTSPTYAPVKFINLSPGGMYLTDEDGQLRQDELLRVQGWYDELVLANHQIMVGGKLEVMQRDVRTIVTTAYPYEQPQAKEARQ